MGKKSKSLKKEKDTSVKVESGNVSAPKSRIDRRIWIALAVIILFVIIMRVRMINVPLERDEGLYAVNAMDLLDGIAPYDQSYDIKLPGLFAVYAIIMTVFGKTIAGLHTGLLLFILMTLALIFILVRRFYDPLTATMAAGCYAVLSLSQNVQGFTTNSEPLSFMPALLGIVLMLKALDTRRLKDFLLAGLVLGTAFIIKQTVAHFILFSGLYIIFRYIKDRPIDYKRSLKELILFSAGVFFPFVFVCIAIKLAGTFENFWLWTITVPSKYVARIPLPTAKDIFLRRVSVVLGSQLLIWMLAGFGLLSMVWDRISRRGVVFVTGFSIFSFFALSTGFYFRPHYFIFLLPALSILAAIGAASIARFIKRDDLGRVRTVVAVLIMSIVVLSMMIKERKYLFAMTPNEISRSTYGANPFVESIPVAKYIKDRTTPDDRIFVFGSEPQIYFYAQRRASSGHHMLYAITGKGFNNNELALSIRESLFRDLEKEHPKYVVYINVYTSWLASVRTDPYPFNWISNYIRKNYDVVALVDSAFTYPPKYYWDADVAKAGQNLSLYSVQVYKRKRHIKK